MHVSTWLNQRIDSAAEGNAVARDVLTKLSATRGGPEALHRLFAVAPEVRGVKIQSFLENFCGGDPVVFRNAINDYLDAKAQARSAPSAKLAAAIPSADFVRSRLVRLSDGTTHICDLSRRQAEALVAFGKKVGVTGSLHVMHSTTLESVGAGKDSFSVHLSSVEAAPDRKLLRALGYADAVPAEYPAGAPAPEQLGKSIHTLAGRPHLCGLTRPQAEALLPFFRAKGIDCVIDVLKSGALRKLGLPMHTVTLSVHPDDINKLTDAIASL